MNFKIIYYLFFIFYLTNESIELRQAPLPYIIQIDFSNYINKSEQELIDDPQVNWVRTDYQNAYNCQGQQIKRDPDLLALLPKKGKFMANYIYARPKFDQPLIGDLITYSLNLPTKNAFVDFIYSQDIETKLRVFLWTKNKHKDNIRLIWQNTAKIATPGLVSARAKIENLIGPFKLIFQAEVKALYPYLFRTYLSQIVIDRVVINSFIF